MNLILRNLKRAGLGMPWKCVCLLVLWGLFVCELRAAETALADLDLTAVTQDWQTPRANRGVDGSPLSVNHKKYAAGVGMHANASWTLKLDGKAAAFRALVGVQDAPNRPTNEGSVIFIVRGDGRELFRSGLMRPNEEPKPVNVSLAGIKTLSLQVTDGGNGNSADHADWLEAVIVHDGAPLTSASAVALPPLVEPPGGPSNAPAIVQWEAADNRVRLWYQGQIIFDGRIVAPSGVALRKSETVTGEHALQQVITFTADGDLRLEGVVTGSGETLAAELRGAAQKQFPLVRTSNGASRNWRNNAVYDRHWDWVLSGPDQQTRLTPAASNQFSLSITGRVVELTFKPRYYQKHKNLPFYQPWTYRVRQDSISGWCSWWAYMRNFKQKDLESLLQVWKEKRFDDFGYRFIQIDDCFQGGEHDKHTLLKGTGYPGGHPETWLVWRKELFPGGMDGYVSTVKQAGFQPGIWIGSHFGDMTVAAQHPDWLICDTAGKPFAGPWIGYAIDASNPRAVEALIRPTYHGIQQSGFSYVKIDILRHYLYDNLHRNLEACVQRGVRPDEVLRSYLRTARQELGPETFILSCWGVLPESIGLADACRIGGDGYGPVTMQQYNSWNGIVWRNDPDHCDVFPRFKPAEAGNVTKTLEVVPANNDTVIRPALASIAGCLLMLSDKPEVYRDDRNIEGAKRSAPVLFSVPGQLYDYDESKTSKLRTMERTKIRSGAQPSPIDADQFGPVCSWWLNEFDRAFDHWNVLHRINWSKQAEGEATVRFADLGLDAGREYLVYEFWTHQFAGVLREKMVLPGVDSMGLRSYAIREKLGRPQVLSTSRHLSQGGVDLMDVQWREGTGLSGRSRVVAGDRYQLVLYVPEGFVCRGVIIGGKPAEIKTEGPILRATGLPEKTGELEWNAGFLHK